MRASPSIVPGGIDRDVYLVLDDFGMGCAWRETNVEDTDLEAVINDVLEGQYKNPVCVGRKLKSACQFPPPTVWAISARAVVPREAAGEAPTMTAQPMAAPWVARG